MPLIEVLKWDASPKVFAYKYPNCELNTKSQLIVSESQEAVLVKEGPCLCVFKTVTGRECPGCGLTRAFFHLLHGEWDAAVRFNWRCLIVFPILAFLAWKKIVTPTRRK